MMTILWLILTTLLGGWIGDYFFNGAIAEGGIIGFFIGAVVSMFGSGGAKAVGFFFELLGDIFSAID
jgi:hypothetical protein